MGLLLFFALQKYLADWPSWFTLVSTFSIFLFVPFPLILIITWQIRSRIILTLSFGMLILFSILFGHLFLPRPTASPLDDATLISFTTFNLGPGTAKPEQVVTEVEATDSDIIAVQEMTAETAQLLKTRLAKKYPNQILNVTTHSTGLLSRYPISASEWFQPASEGRGTLYTLIIVKGSPLHLFAPHLLPPDITWWKDYPIPIGLDDQPQQRQLADIANRANAIGSQVVIMGDLNINDQTHAYPQLASKFRDTYREVGWGLGYTFPSGLRIHNLFPNSALLGTIPVPGPLVRLDYIFHTADITAQDAHVHCRGGSDHCYLTAKLRLQ